MNMAAAQAHLVAHDDKLPTLAPIRTSTISAGALPDGAVNGRRSSANYYDQEALGQSKPGGAGRRATAGAPFSSFPSSSKLGPFSCNSARPDHDRDLPSAMDSDRAVQCPAIFANIVTGHIGDSRQQYSSSSPNSSSASSCMTSCTCFLSSCASRRRKDRRQISTTPCSNQRRRSLVRSMKMMFPAAGGIYSPVAGHAFSRSFSGQQIQHYAPSPRTPRTPSSTPFQQAPGKLQHQFLSPRAPNCNYAIPSPSSAAADLKGSALCPTSTSSTRKRSKASKLLMIPPSMVGKKKASDQPAPDMEPTSPHVTCIGRVTRQTRCKKLHLGKDMATPCSRTSTHSMMEATKKGNLRKEPGPTKVNDPYNCHYSGETRNVAVPEACVQMFGKKKLHDLYKIHSIHEDSPAVLSDGGSDDCDVRLINILSTSASKASISIPYLPSRNANINLRLGDTEKNEYLNGLPGDMDIHVDREPLAGAIAIRSTCVDHNTSAPPAEERSCTDHVDVSVISRTTCSNLEAIMSAMQGEPLSSHLELPVACEPQDPRHQCPHQRCLLLTRNSNSRRLSEADRDSSPRCVITVPSV